MIAEQLVILPLLDTYDNEPLFKENIHLSALLRLAQFHVAAWANRTDRLLIIADRLLTETETLSHKEIVEGLRCLAVSSILSERLLAMSPRKWVPLVEELEGILSSEGTFIETYGSRPQPDYGRFGRLERPAVSLRRSGEFSSGHWRTG